MAIFGFMNFFGQGLATFLSILLLLYTKDTELTSQSIFSLMVYMAVIDMCWSWSVPLALSLTAHVTNSLYRIQAFLEISECSAAANDAISETPPSDQTRSKAEITGENSEETIPLVNSTGNASFDDQSGDSLNCFVSLHEVTCKPPLADMEENDQSNSLLSSITLSAADLKGLVVVVGGVGSGKSSLLSCILGGELCVSAGAVARSGKFAYVAQTPWVFPGTVRENIVFGSAYNEFWYAKTVEVCQLAADFMMFPEGDLSLIGEHGSTVSGGQRTRIALARAVYSQADIYLLDDPFSALDARVADSIFNECLRGLLAGRIVFLATHNLRFLSEADYVVRLHLGTVVAKGDYLAVKEKFTQIRVEDENEDTTKDPKALKTKRDEISGKMDQSESLGQELRQDEEDRETGNVKLKVYWEYFKHGLPGLVFIAIAVVFCIGQGRAVIFNSYPIHLVSSRLVSSTPLLSFPLLSSPLVSSRFLSFPLLSSPLLSSPLLSSRPVPSHLSFRFVSFLSSFLPPLNYYHRLPFMLNCNFLA